MTRKLYDIQGNYGQGWESVCCEDSRHEALDRLREYNDNERTYPHRIIVVHERLESPTD
jgi:hypothetical protein